MKGLMRAVWCAVITVSGGMLLNAAGMEHPAYFTLYGFACATIFSMYAALEGEK